MCFLQILLRNIANVESIFDGNAIAPNRPGHGVEFNLEKLVELSV